jgi:colanic acid/amylovoran biosynthesis glycosyltransferase
MSSSQEHSDSVAQPLRIAYLVNWYPAPSHAFIRREILALEELGYTIRRFSIRHGEVAAAGGADATELLRTQVLLAAGIPRILTATILVFLCNPYRALKSLLLAGRMGMRSDRGLLRHLAYLAEAAILWRATRRDIDLVHAHFGTNSTMVAMLCTALGGPPFSFTAHGPDEFERFEGIALREKVARAHFVAAISNYGRSQLWRVAPIQDWGKVAIVRCGVDATFLAPERHPIPEAPDILWVGRLGAEKGIPVLLDACAILHNAGVAFRLKLVGGGDLEVWTRAQIIALDLSSTIEMLGWQTAEQIRDHIDQSRGLVLASFAEGLPVVLMEAMARERPVVATRIAGIPELVEQGVSGWLVTVGRPDELADAMADLLHSTPERLARMGRAGRLRVETHHDAQREAQIMSALMRGSTSVEHAPSAPSAGAASLMGQS